MTRWLVVGGTGMLGRDVVARLAGQEVRAVGSAEVDVTDPAAVDDAVAGSDVVVNCAAYTAVDAAESDEGQAFAVNAVGPQLLARACGAAAARLVHVSTDYVFDGAADRPYEEDAPLRPRSAYGRTKAAGEWAVRAGLADHLVVRTAWLYGEHGSCFPRTMARLAADRDELRVVDDQVGQPTWTADVADLIVRLVAASAPSGTYHATSSGSTSWHGFTRSVMAALGKDPDMVRPTTSAEFSRPAPRPAYSVLGHGALLAAGVAPIGRWDERWEVAASAVLGR
ncbi:dTDP-4-dehydrorhamnose reductase [Georgenia thermotolerans]|uniref:dTDP-4-dehydrorhamnose reductase n=1 Tax=Georgenia thermotolerans TaxID=527326 RepID=A0A7J5UQ67_9MICO|nr:dTDP-4-dehydrorhamnose reductase [Georgenia thermotolerans]KAE8764558.1 dTDP-4-dehydrorhamnose reductase [Georgenia thermotolerans]